MDRDKIADAIAACVLLLALVIGAWAVALGSCPTARPSKVPCFAEIDDLPLFTKAQCDELAATGRTSLAEAGEVAIFHGDCPELRYSLEYQDRA